MRSAAESDWVVVRVSKLENASGSAIVTNSLLVRRQAHEDAKKVERRMIAKN